MGGIVKVQKGRGGMYSVWRCKEDICLVLLCGIQGLRINYLAHYLQYKYKYKYNGYTHESKTPLIPRYRSKLPSLLYLPTPFHHPHPHIHKTSSRNKFHRAKRSTNPIYSMLSPEPRSGPTTPYRTLAEMGRWPKRLSYLTSP